MRALALTAILAGCAPTWSEPLPPWQEPRNLVVCVDIPTAHLDAARSAIVKWDTALRGWRRVVMVESHPTPECDKTIQVTESWLPEDDAAAGWVPSVGGSEIFLVRGRYERDVEGVVLHELGHAFGAQHVAGTLMHPTTSPRNLRCPDVVTVAQVAAFNRIDLETLGWCRP